MILVNPIEWNNSLLSELLLIDTEHPTIIQATGLGITWSFPPRPLSRLFNVDCVYGNVKEFVTLSACVNFHNLILPILSVLLFPHFVSVWVDHCPIIVVPMTCMAALCTFRALFIIVKRFW